MEEPSDRLIDQRLRNRIIDVVSTLADGNDGVLREWPTEYFEMFYDYIPHGRDGVMRRNSAMSEEERQSLLDVSEILDEACDATPQTMTPDELIQTGWPKRIQPVAKRALEIMSRHGRFSEDEEQDKPSLPQT